jgi:hypothetical protein
VTFEMTEEGVVEDGHPHEDHLAVCPGLPAGRSRFVYFEAGANRSPWSSTLRTDAPRFVIGGRCCRSGSVKRS